MILDVQKIYEKAVRLKKESSDKFFKKIGPQSLIVVNKPYIDESENQTDKIINMSLDEFEKANLVIPIWSEVLQTKIMFISTGSLTNRVPDDIVWYSAKELKNLTSKNEISVEIIKAIHKTKKIIRRSKIINNNYLSKEPVLCCKCGKILNPPTMKVINPICAKCWLKFNN